MYTFELNSSFIYILLVAFFLLVKFFQNKSWNEKMIFFFFLGEIFKSKKWGKFLFQLINFYIYFLCVAKKIKMIMILHSYLAYNQIWLNLHIDDSQHIENLPPQKYFESKFKGFRICNSPLTFWKRSEK